MTKYEFNKINQKINDKVFIKIFWDILIFLFQLCSLYNLIKRITVKGMNKKFILASVCTLELLWFSFTIYDFKNYTTVELIIDFIFDPIIIGLCLTFLAKEQLYNKFKNYLFLFTFFMGFYGLFWGFVNLSSIQNFKNIMASSSNFISFFGFLSGVFLCYCVFKLKYELD